MEKDPLGPEAVARNDPAGMFPRMAALGAQGEEALRLAKPVLSKVPRAQALVYAGMGGSAIPGEVAASFLAGSSKVPIAVARGYDLLASAGASSLLLAVSHSGDTEETLSQVDQALARGVPVAAVASGGRLAALSREHGFPCVPLPPGGPPRASFGHLFFAASAVACAAVGVDRAQDLSAAATDAKAFARELAPEVPAAKNPAKQLALSLHGKTPVVYGVGPAAAIARRFSQSLHENAKVFAFRGSFPEMNHNEIVAWDADPRAKEFAAVILTATEPAAPMARRLAFTCKLFKERAGVLLEPRAPGSGLLQSLVNLTLLGDLASLYLATLRRVDPGKVDAIDRLKRALRGET